MVRLSQVPIVLNVSKYGMEFEFHHFSYHTAAQS